MEKEYNVSMDIYSLDVITRAVCDFSDVADIIYKNDILHISWSSAEEIEEIFNEFMNYVLSI